MIDDGHMSHQWLHLLDVAKLHAGLTVARILLATIALISHCLALLIE